MKKPAPEKFASEAEMCAKFIAAIGPLWTAYAETGGWDILLSRKSDGLQVGIQAKLLMNAHVVSQCLDERYQWGLTGPDHRAILVPSYATPFSEKICQTIGITIITVQKGEKKYYQRNVFRPLLPVETFTKSPIRTGMNGALKSGSSFLNMCRMSPPDHQLRFN